MKRSSLFYLALYNNYPTKLLLSISTSEIKEIRKSEEPRKKSLKPIIGCGNGGN